MDVLNLMPIDDALPHLTRLRVQADALFDRAQAEYRDQMQCRPGCFGCCQGGLSLTQVEAHVLREGLRALDAPARAVLRAHVQHYVRDNDTTYCALLVEGQCGLYAARPLICRTHGMPLRFTETSAEGEEDVFVDVCPLNFTEPDALENVEPALMLDLDHLNTALVMIDRLASLGAERVAILDLLCQEFDVDAPPAALED